MAGNSRTTLKFLLPVVLLTGLAAGLFAWWQSTVEPEDRIIYARDRGAPVDHGLEGISESGELVILTVKGPTTWREKDGVTYGYDADLAEEMAEALGAEPVFRSYPDLRSLIAAIERGDGHIAAASLTRRERAGAEALFGPAYKNIRSQIVCRRGTSLPQSADGLAGLELAVVADSAAEDALQKAVNSGTDLEWTSQIVSSPLPLLQDVSQGKIDCVAAESHQVALARVRYPNLDTAFNLASEDQQLAWLIAPQSRDLLPWMTSWFADLHENGFLATLDERYYGHLAEFDWFDMSTFHDRIDSRLPRYEEYFRSAAGDNNLDWTMLAAQGYQESHWDPDAVSPTGVRGLMMLTRPTAKELGVSDRTDPRESIYGGARYMERLYDRMPEDVTGYDRLWMAMAAYNVGYGHLLDARRLATRMGEDPNQWHVIDDMLPLLTKKQYYSTVPHGYARGYEPVHYVKRIREYDEALTYTVPAPERPPFYLERLPGQPSSAEMTEADELEAENDGEIDTIASDDSDADNTGIQ